MVWFLNGNIYMENKYSKFNFLKLKRYHIIIKFRSELYNWILSKMYKIAVMCGSLRKASTNAGILRAILDVKD